MHWYSEIAGLQNLTESGYVTPEIARTVRDSEYTLLSITGISNEIHLSKLAQTSQTRGPQLRD